jgi:hypothetical protein
MGIFDRLFGRNREPERRPAQRRDYRPDDRSLTDEQALERYRYLLRTAPPEAIEQAHAEAFARLTPEQRQMVLEELASTVPPHERVGRDDPRSLARLATRAELRQPGTIERVFGGMGGGGWGGPGMMGGGIGLGGMLAGSLLASLAGSVIGTAIANEFFDHDPGFNDPGYADTLGAGDLSGDPGQGALQELGYGAPLDAPDAGAGDTLAEDPFGDVGGDYGGDDFGGEM